MQPMAAIESLSEGRYRGPVCKSSVSSSRRKLLPPGNFLPRNIHVARTPRRPCALIICSRQHDCPAHRSPTPPSHAGILDKDKRIVGAAHGREQRIAIKAIHWCQSLSETLALCLSVNVRTKLPARTKQSRAWPAPTSPWFTRCKTAA